MNAGHAKTPVPSRAGARAAALAGLGVALFAGCEPSSSVKSGAPLVLSFGPVSAADGSPIDLGGAGGAPGVVPAPPLTNFVALFDRLLDGDSLEDADGGVAKAGLAQVQSGVPTQLVPFTTNYVPNGDSKLFALFPQGPTLTVLPICGLPAAAASVQVSLELTKFRSHDRKANAMAAPGVATALSFMTAPLSVTTDVPPPTQADPVTGAPAGPAVVDPTKTFTLTFNALTPGPAVPAACGGLADASTHIHVTAQVGADPAAPIAAVIAQDMMNPSHWTSSPPGTTADGPGAWPAGAVVTVTIDAATTDTYGVALGTATNASFMVKS